MFSSWQIGRIKVIKYIPSFVILALLVSFSYRSCGSTESIHAKKESEDTLQNLINLSNFKFIIKNSKICNECKDILIVALIKTALGHIEHRKAIRSTWAKQAKCQKFIFLTGITHDLEKMRQIQNESDKHHDIIQGNFIDTYNNLTYKHIMALKWVTHYCPNAKYVVKADDDVMVNTSLLVQKLVNNDFGNKSLIACETISNAKVYRNKSKWAVSRKEYPDDYFPTYCKGPFIIYSADVVRNLLRESYKVPYFFIDDVHVTGTLAKRLGYKHLQLLDSWYTRTTREIMSKSPGHIKASIYGPIELKPKDIIKIWKHMHRL